MADSAFHAVVRGRVQGVYFRGSTRKQAKNLHLTGWVKNLPDGGVEVMACGDTDKLKKLRKWLHSGPIAAKVSSVTITECPWQRFNDFDILYNQCCSI